jgi:hypothetical protein
MDTGPAAPGMAPNLNTAVWRQFAVCVGLLHVLPLSTRPLKIFAIKL